MDTSQAMHSFVNAVAPVVRNAIETINEAFKPPVSERIGNKYGEFYVTHDGDDYSHPSWALKAVGRKMARRMMEWVAIQEHSAIVGGGYTCVQFRAEMPANYVGKVFDPRTCAVGFAKYNPRDAKDGRPYSRERGIEIATGRAYKALWAKLTNAQLETIWNDMVEEGDDEG